jgi:serine/threonine-protein kinase SRPK3
LDKIWELLAGQGLFQRGDQNQYSPVMHLAEMIALLGPVPSILIEREKDMRRWHWSAQICNDKGDLCSNALEYYGGPFFTDAGQFTRNDAIPFSRSLRHEVPDCIKAEEVDEFLRFMRRMLRWLPEERATARELKDDPWLVDNSGQASISQ